MAYFAAVISLKNTIQRLLNFSQFSILSPPQEILEFAFDEVRAVQEVLQNKEELIIKNCDNERVTSLTGQIREAVYKLEDALESHALDQYESLADKVYLHFEEVKEEINYFVETMKQIEKMMMEERSRPLPEEEEDVVPLKTYGGKSSKMVGLSKEFDELKGKINYGTSFPGCHFFAIHGMAGIGKTTLAMKIFEDPSISSHFNRRVFVTVGPKYQSKKVKVMLSIPDQMNYDVEKIRMEEDVDLAKYILSSLQGRKYLIVFDDIWNKLDLLDLFSLLPEEESNPSVVLVTSRLKEVAKWYWRESYTPINFHYGFTRPMRFLNKEESWDLLCEKVFGEWNLCPFQLEKFGKKIAEHCEGLPLTIVTVANILSNREKTLEYWKKVAEKQTSVFTDAYDQMFDVLILSYNYLPQYLKPCFLYMGVFPLSCKIPYSKLVKLWHVEQFTDLNSFIGFKDFVKGCLRDLLSKNVVLDNQLSSRSTGTKKWIKTCSLHSAFWHLCVKQASKEKFLHVANHVSSFTQSTKNQRRLCTHNNVLFGIKEVHKSIEAISTARSLLCTGPHHQYPVPICFRLRLLRVLDALTIRFYKFPIEVLKLVQLRYLAFTYNGKLPGSLSKLWNLMYLIVHRHLCIKKSSRDSSYLPMEIWDMKELRHIQVMGGNLLDPCGAFLPNLLTLSDISVNSCSKEILKKTPNLRKIGIQIELTPDGLEPLYCFDHISHLHRLESLKCVLVNPKPSSQVVGPITTLPSSLIKLSLSGLGFPWEYMRTIAKLPRLQVLKLHCYAFQGPVWETSDDDVFLLLKYLLLEDIDLVRWRGNYKICFPKLRRLFIRHCYKLKEILSSWIGLPITEIVDCPSLRLSTEQLQKKYPQYHDIKVHSSLDEEK